MLDAARRCRRRRARRRRCGGSRPGVTDEVNGGVPNSQIRRAKSRRNGYVGTLARTWLTVAVIPLVWLPRVENLLAQNIRVPAMLCVLPQDLHHDPVQRQGPSPVTGPDVPAMR